MVICNRKTSTSSMSSMFSQAKQPFRSGSSLADGYQEEQPRLKRSFKTLVKKTIPPPQSTASKTSPALLSITELLHRTMKLTHLASPSSADALNVTFENEHTHALSPNASLINGSQLQLRPTSVASHYR